MKKRNRNSGFRVQGSGFTLVEILVVITIFTIVAAGIAQTFASGVKLWSRAKADSGPSLEILVALEMVSRELRQSVNVTPSGFEGKEDEISFLTFTGDSVVKVTYKFDFSQKELVRREMDLKSALSDDIGDKDTYTEKNIASLDNFSFSYLDFDKDKEEYAWVGEWAKEQGVFGVVKLKAKAKDEEAAKTVFIPIS